MKAKAAAAVVGWMLSVFDSRPFLWLLQKRIEKKSINHLKELRKWKEKE
jgi:hypothetical protein